MWVERVTAVSFGALVDRDLPLARGLNIVVGRSGTGKSTWHAALHAALCGQPAHGTDADKWFRDLWVPQFDDEPTDDDWGPPEAPAPRREEWAVNVRVVRADGSGLDVEQDLARSASVATSWTGASTGTPIHDHHRTVELVRRFSWDRYAYAATSWIEQDGNLPAGSNPIEQAVLTFIDDAHIRAAVRWIEDRLTDIRGSNIRSGLLSAALESYRRAEQRVGHRNGLQKTRQSQQAMVSVARDEKEREDRALRATQARRAEMAAAKLQDQIYLRTGERPPGAGDRLADAPTSTFRDPSAVSAGVAGFPSRGNTFDSPRTGYAVAGLNDPNVASRPAPDVPHLAKGNDATVMAAADRLARVDVALAAAVGTTRATAQAPTSVPDGWPWRRRWTYALAIGGGLALVGLVLLAVAGPLTGGIFLVVAVIAAVTFLTFPFSALRSAAIVTSSPSTTTDVTALRDEQGDALRQLTAALKAAGRTEFSDPRLELDRYRQDAGRRSNQDHRPLDQLRADLARANQEFAEAEVGLYPSEIQAANPDELHERMSAATRAGNRYDATVAALQETERDFSALADPDPDAAAAAARALCDRLQRAEKTLEEAAEGLQRAQLSTVQGLVAGINARLGGQMKGIISDRMIDVRVRDGLRLDIRESMRRGARRGFGSHSTRQLSHAFARIALGQHVCDSRSLTALPLLVDDIVSGSDPDRIAQVLRVLAAIAQQGRQVVLFTQNPTAEDWAVAQHKANGSVHIVRLRSVDEDPQVHQLPPEEPPASRTIGLNNLTEHFAPHTHPDISG